MDRFVGKSLVANMPLTLVNHAQGPHGFDLFENSHTSREVIKGVLGFLGSELSS